MSKRLSSASAVTGLIVSIIGLLNVVLGGIAVISGALPSAEGKFLAPAIGVGSIVFGLVMLAAGAFWITSGVGYFILKEWAPTLALYVSPVIVAINVAGVMHLWGFVVNIGWAALSTVAGVGSIWYLSKKELASFFLISVAEHVGVLVIFAIAIYSEPMDIAESSDREVIVTIEEIEEQQEPLLAEIIPREAAMLQKPPALPKIEIESVTATDPGTEIEDSAPQLPRTVARITDAGADMVLRSPGLKVREQRYEDTIPALDMESALESSKKPSLEIGPSEKMKEGPEVTVARPPEYVRDDVSSPDERLGPSDEVARPSFAGEISGEIAGRKVVFWPKQPKGYKGTEGGSVVIKFWVDAAGSVTKVEISKKSGNPGLDKMAKEYVEQIRFEELPKNVKRRMYDEVKGYC
jgi:TonB family protein